jgi:6,7-dimethyl-8-ribityllumazine synthase
MPRIIEGKIEGRGLKVGIVVSRFNDFVTGRLLDGALDSLSRHGVADGDIIVVKVPGALEIVPAAKILSARGGLSAIICLGAVIRGETPHFDYVSAEVSKGIALLSFECAMPVINGVLTTDSVDQAIDRAGAKAGNKGYTAAQNAIEMVDLQTRLGELKGDGPKKNR